MCRVDGGQWRECEENSELPLNDGRHSLLVMAVDPTGRSDPNPVAYAWEVCIFHVVPTCCVPVLRTRVCFVLEV